MTSKLRSRKQALVTQTDDGLYRRIADLLRGSGIDVHKAHWDDTTLELVQSTPFDVIVIGYPVSHESLAGFLATARAEGSACRRAGLVLVAAPELDEEARELIGKGANRVVSTEDLEPALGEAVDELTGTAPRLMVRAPATIKLFADGRPLRVMAQIENLSTSGMLLRGVTQFPVGTTFDFEISVPGESAPIRGTAEITRATDPYHESIEGIGVRFVGFTGSDRIRLEMYLGRKLP
jgi:CheY-like chemotaxis protein